MEDLLQVRESARGPQIASAIAESMGLLAARSREAKINDTLCAPGKIAISRDILSRSGEWAGLEFAPIKTHPQAACNLLRPITFSGNTLSNILQLHERLDGSASPLGLKGKAIRLDTETYLSGDLGVFLSRDGRAKNSVLGASPSPTAPERMALANSRFPQNSPRWQRLSHGLTRSLFSLLSLRIIQGIDIGADRDTIA